MQVPLWIVPSNGTCFYQQGLSEHSHTQTLHIAYGCFQLQKENWLVVTEPTWPAKPSTFIMWLSQRRKIANLSWEGPTRCGPAQPQPHLQVLRVWSPSLPFSNHRPCLPPPQGLGTCSSKHFPRLVPSHQSSLNPNVPMVFVGHQISLLTLELINLIDSFQDLFFGFVYLYTNYIPQWKCKHHYGQDLVHLVHGCVPSTQHHSPS